MLKTKQTPNQALERVLLPLQADRRMNLQKWLREGSDLFENRLRGVTIDMDGLCPRTVTVGLPIMSCSEVSGLWCLTGGFQKSLIWETCPQRGLFIPRMMFSISTGRRGKKTGVICGLFWISTKIRRFFLENL